MASESKYELTIKYVDGSNASDPAVIVRVLPTSGDHTIRQVGPINVDPRILIDGLPAYPGLTSSMYADFAFSRFQSGRSPFFSPNDGETTKHTITVVRDRNKWTPLFAKLAALPSRFDRLRAVVNASDTVEIVGGPQIGALGSAYNDGLNSPKAQLAKMCLLNLYAVLQDGTNPVSGRPWFDAVRRFVRLGEERFVAEVDQPLYEDVNRILRNWDHFGSLGYFHEPDAKPHADNFPTRYGVIAKETVSVKLGYQAGNVQFTIAPSHAVGTPTYLLDCDMDENSKLLTHFGDMIAHTVTGGTHPIDMHEYILHDSAQVNDGVATVDLGYELVSL